MAWKFSKEALESGAVEASSEMLEKAEVVSGSETVERSSEQVEADIEREQKEVEAQVEQFSNEVDALTEMELTEDEQNIVEQRLADYAEMSWDYSSEKKGFLIFESIAPLVGSLGSGLAAVGMEGVGLAHAPEAAAFGLGIGVALSTLLKAGEKLAGWIHKRRVVAEKRAV